MDSKKGRAESRIRGQLRRGKKKKKKKKKKWPQGPNQVDADPSCKPPHEKRILCPAEQSPGTETIGTLF